ncbi:hypothetical protein KNT87_gp140 [Erwinia phage Cronus]|uniref:Uncharacterized protein n=1 Tax=Erwinia phage Cronus TaxID=2163633 RepID=A0A2S1GM27_9CAUD|nr:hypothetical protein KNT87_gp140 [Erwinia phage Cronus]AWD90429.1 hypothetical protein [Erwinia phage Cronus]
MELKMIKLTKKFFDELSAENIFNNEEAFALLVEFAKREDTDFNTAEEIINHITPQLENHFSW